MYGNADAAVFRGSYYIDSSVRLFVEALFFFFCGIVGF